MNNAELDRKLYKYSDSEVLRNKYGITDARELDEAERQAVSNRIRQGCPTGKFDLKHLQAIHRHLFQDVYEWAGELRQVDFHKGDSWFHPHARLEMGMADVHKRLEVRDYLKNLDPERFAAEAADVIGDVNRLHPFREGNGRTQFQYLKQLAERAGHTIDLARFSRDEWITASQEANRFDMERMERCIFGALSDQTQSEGRGQGR